MRHSEIRFISLLAAFFSVSTIVSLLCAQSSAPITEHDVAVQMRDGVILRADIYRPGGEGKFPVIVTRTPYSKGSEAGNGVKAAANGIVFIAEDCRGRYASGGEWYPYRVEGNDGFDTVEWAARLPYSSGRVAVSGGSYAGVTALLAAASQPPHLVAAAILESGADYYNGWSYIGGVLQQNFIETWASVLSFNSIPPGDGGFGPLGHGWVYNMDLPISQYPIAKGATPKETGFFKDFLAHPSDDAYWHSLSADPSKINVPVFMIAGWYDQFSLDAITTFNAIRARGASESARRESRLIVGPWTHGGFTPMQGTTDFGPGSTKDVATEMLSWLRSQLGKSGDPQPANSSIGYFTMGANVWNESKLWPPESVHALTLRLDSGGNANTLSGDGALLFPGSALHASSDTYKYDPMDPVPTTGGGLCCSVVAPGAFSQLAVEERKDVLVYTTPALGRDLEVTGNVSLHLFVRSTGTDTDFTGKLVDVADDGSTHNVCDGIQRMRFSRSLSQPNLSKPGEIVEITVNLGPTSNTFLTGHRVRLEVSSSNFPKFARNLDTGDDGYDSTRSVSAMNTIVHDRNHPSALIVDTVASSR
jgi:putative CocE/NonD family hydrolase